MDGGGNGEDRLESAPTGPSKLVLECARLTAAGLLATAVLCGTGALAGTALDLTMAAPAGASSPATFGANDHSPDDFDATTGQRGADACFWHAGDPYRPSAGHGPVVKAVTVTEPGGSTRHYTTTDARTYGSEFSVSQGATVAVTITWDPTTFRGTTVGQVRDCVYSSFSPWRWPYGSGRDLGAPPDTVRERAPNSGTFTTSYTITQSPGTTVCDRGSVSGEPTFGTGNTGTEKSAQLCFTVEMPAVTPEVPSVLLLPASAALVGFGAFFADRRRRAKRAPV